MTTKYRAFLVAIVLLFVCAIVAQPQQTQTTESAQNNAQRNSADNQVATGKTAGDSKSKNGSTPQKDSQQGDVEQAGANDLAFAKPTSTAKGSTTQKQGQTQSNSSNVSSEKTTAGTTQTATAAKQTTAASSPFASGTSTSDTPGSLSSSETSSPAQPTQTSNPQTNTNGSSPSNQGSPSSTVATTTPATTSPPQSPSCGAYWGAYVNSPQRTGGYNATDKLQAISYVESQMGRTFDIDHQFYRWDDFVTTYNINNYIKPSIAQGRKPFLSWKPVFKNNTNIAWASIAGGDHDVLIREKAQQVKSIGSPVILVFGHEADSRIGPFQPGQTESGHVKTDAGSAADFVAAYRHVHTVFAQEGVTNVDWAWIMTRAPFEPNAGARAANLLYPGDSYVDIVGLDPYNFFHGGNWREMQTLMSGFTSWATANNINKPWMLAEWGSVEDPNQAGRKAQWLRNAADYFESEPRIKYLIHFDSFPEYNWRFDSSPSSAAAWADISNRSYFTCP